MYEIHTFLLENHSSKTKTFVGKINCFYIYSYHGKTHNTTQHNHTTHCPNSDEPHIF